MKYCCDEIGIESMNRLISASDVYFDEIKELVKSIQDMLDTREEGELRISSDIADLLRIISHEIDSVDLAYGMIKIKLADVVEGYKEILNDKVFR